MRKIILFLNPLSRLGVDIYSIWFPFLTTLAFSIFSEIFANIIVKDPAIVGAYVVFINIAMIIYFAFRDGIRGGSITTIITIFYYFYIIFTRHYTGTRLTSGITTSIILGMIYLSLSFIIGWLKQTIDQLIQKESKARLQAEQDRLQLQTILQQLPVGVLMIDADGNLNGNKQTEKILGIKIPNYLNTQSQVYKGKKLLPPRQWPINRAFEKGEIILREEIEFTKLNKKHLFLRVNAAPIKDGTGKTIAAVSTIYDITQEKELEQKKDDFVNMASHELKTPITSLKLYTDSLMSQLLKFNDSKIRRTLESIKKQTDKLQKLSTDLLDVTRIQTGKLSINKEEFNLNSLIKETIELVEGIDKKHEIIFNSKIQIDISADRFRIYQVITNLLTNAIKYSPEKSTINITIKKDNHNAIIKVQDSGIGIDKDQQKKIFDRLYQVNDATEKTFPGLGMGLYISQEIIKKHKGKIWVEGEKGKGSSFYIKLPL